MSKLQDLINAKNLLKEYVTECEKSWALLAQQPNIADDVIYRIRQLKKDHMALAQTYGEIKTQFESIQKEATDLRARLVDPAKTQADYDTQQKVVKDLQDEITRVRKSDDEHASQAAVLQSRVLVAEERLSQCQQRGQGMNTQYQALLRVAQQSQTELDRFRLSNKQRISVRDEQYQTLAKQWSEAQAKIAEYEKNLIPEKDLAKKRAEYELYVKEMKEMNTTVSALRAQEEKLRKSIEELQKQNKEPSTIISVPPTEQNRPYRTNTFAGKFGPSSLRYEMQDRAENVRERDAKDTQRLEKEKLRISDAETVDRNNYRNERTTRPQNAIVWPQPPPPPPPPFQNQLVRPRSVDFADLNEARKRQVDASGTVPPMSGRMLSPTYRSASESGLNDAGLARMREVPNLESAPALPNPFLDTEGTIARPRSASSTSTLSPVPSDFSLSPTQPLQNPFGSTDDVISENLEIYPEDEDQAEPPRAGGPLTRFKSRQSARLVSSTEPYKENLFVTKCEGKRKKEDCLASGCKWEKRRNKRSFYCH